MAARTDREVENFRSSFKLFKKYSLSCILLMTVCQLLTQTVGGGQLRRFDGWYATAVEAYMNERWFECSNAMQNALEYYQDYQKIRLKCRDSCVDNLVPDVNPPAYIQGDFLNDVQQKSRCIIDCEQKKLDVYAVGNAPISPKDLAEFEDLTPYNYLQFCAYKSEKYELAASSAFTYLAAHPEHTDMQNNVAFYQTLDQLQPSHFYDVEAKLHQVHFLNGKESYHLGNFGDTVKNIEAALDEYWAESDRCRLMCEDSYEEKVDKTLLGSVIKEYLVPQLQCSDKCINKLATINGHVLDGYFIELFNYLQFSYYKLNELEKAAECTQTFLEFRPDDEDMLKNKEFYLESGVKPGAFTARESAVIYLRRLQYEANLLFYVQSEFNTKKSSQQLNENDLNHKKHGPIKRIFGTEPEFKPKDQAYQDKMRKYEQAGVKVTLDDSSLEGNNRVVADGILSEEQCKNLRRLVDVADKELYTHNRKASKSEGLTIDNARQLLEKGTISEDMLQSLMDSSEKSRGYFSDYLNLASPLYFHYTHIFCRSPEDYKKEKASKYSEKCSIRDDSSCNDNGPAYVDRDFSGILYLNDDFQGGSFYFSNKNESVQYTVQPKCGRFVGFHSGDYHDVEPLKEGRRCAIAMWYTLTATQQDMSLAHAETQIKMSKYSSSKREFEDTEKLQTFLNENKINIVAREEELNGPQRFAADQLATEDECEVLSQLATLGIQGDGYKNSKVKSSPHTEHEMFEGLTIKRALELAKENVVSRYAVSLYLTISEKARKLIETYFNLEELYFDFTHLVCRRALDENNLRRTDLSHPIHSDNCHIRNDGSCPREKPAYFERDFSALLYLSDKFVGGDFFFAHKNMSVQSSIHPYMGMMVGFNSSNYHGVKGVLQGKRCALALWFTLDPDYKESIRENAEEILNSIQDMPEGPQRTRSEL